MVPTASPGANQDDEDDAVVVVVVVEAAVRIAVNRAVVVVGTPTVRLAAPTTAERRRIEEDVNMLCVCVRVYVCVCTCVFGFYGVYKWDERRLRVVVNSRGIHRKWKTARIRWMTS